MVEIEKKFMITPEEYDMFCRAYAELPAKAHANYYFDTKDYAYDKKGITCRIRKKDGLCTVTVKIHRVGKPDHSIEKCAMARHEYDASVFEGMDVIPHGVLVTERKEFPLAHGIRVAIDRNTYLGTVDHELEIEYVYDRSRYGEESDSEDMDGDTFIRSDDELFCGDMCDEDGLDFDSDYTPNEEPCFEEAIRLLMNRFPAAEREKLVDSFLYRPQTRKTKSERFFERKRQREGGD